MVYAYSSALAVNGSTKDPTITITVPKSPKVKESKGLTTIDTNKHIFIEYHSGGEFGDINFARSVFLSSGKCPEAKTIDFSNIIFRKHCSFDTTVFKGFANFKATDFKDNTLFINTCFNNPVTFQQSKFHQFTNFTRSEFKANVDMSFMNIKDTATFSFYQTKLPDLIDFSNNYTIPKKIDLTTSYFDSFELYKTQRRWHYINLYASDLSKIKIDYEHFRMCFYKSFYWPDADLTVSPDGRNARISGVNYCNSELVSQPYFKSYIERIFPEINMPTENTFLPTLLSWLGYHEQNPIVDTFINLSINNTHFPKALSNEEIASIYEKELKVFDNEGERSSYENLDIEYKTFRNSWCGIPHIWNCYGYHKEWVFYWMLIFLLLFILTTRIFFKRLANAYILPDIFNITPKSTTNDKGVLTSNAISALTWNEKLLYAIVFTASIFFPFKFDFAKIRPNSFWLIYLFVVYLAGIFCVAYLAAFILQK